MALRPLPASRLLLWAVGLASAPRRYRFVQIGTVLAGVLLCVMIKSVLSRDPSWPELILCPFLFVLLFATVLPLLYLRVIRALVGQDKSPRPSGSKDRWGEGTR